MLLEEFLQTARNQRMTVVGEMAFGEIAGYPFTLRPTVISQQVRSCAAYFVVEGRMPNPVFKELRKSLKPYGALSYMGSDRSRISFTCAGAQSDLWSRLYAGLSYLSQSFQANGIGIPQVCPICKQPGCNALAYINGYVPVHSSCLQNQAYSQIASAESNNRNGNYALGILGALLGALVGSIPTILLMFLLSRISAWLYALIPLGSYYGYKLFGGRMDKKVVLPVVIVFSVLMVFFTELVVGYLSIVKEYSMWLGIGEYLSLYFEVMTVGDIVGDIALPLIFTAIGLFISWDQIRRGNTDFEVSADLTLQTLTIKNPQIAGQTPSAAAMQPDPAAPSEAPLSSSQQAQSGWQDFSGDQDYTGQ
ncbi:MAG: hypothetical protein J6P72_04710 [Firmicutes bacterium]|nr:hypothetical protein [Bacillota bacterium]